MVSLMVKRTLIYSMLVLIIFQSSIAMGDVDLLQQQGSEDLSFNSSSLGFDTQNSSENNIDQLDEQEQDCSNCNLCHGHGCAIILGKTLNLTFERTRIGVSDHIEIISGEILSPLQRPPILRS